MPEVLFTIQLPDESTRECYSPSTVVRDYFTAREALPLAEFRRRSRLAYAEASERVRAKYGFACSSASTQLSEIETWLQPFADDAVIQILTI
jgi:uncharacterized repeat protein (TIGR04042 family)